MVPEGRFIFLTHKLSIESKLKSKRNRDQRDIQMENKKERGRTSQRGVGVSVCTHACTRTAEDTEENGRDGH